MNEAKGRLQWLEKRLEKLLTECHKKASQLLKTSTVSSLGISLANTYLSETQGEQFTPSQCERLFCDIGGYYAKREEDYDGGKQHCYNVTRKVLNSSQKLLQQG